MGKRKIYVCTHAYKCYVLFESYYILVHNEIGGRSNFESFNESDFQNFVTYLILNLTSNSNLSFNLNITLNLNNN